MTRLGAALAGRAPIVLALLAGVGLVLVLAAATPVFEPAADPEASYEAGFSLGWTEASTPAAGELAAQVDAGYERGLDYFVVRWEERFAAALLELHARSLATAVGGPFDQGFDAGRADALAGLPAQVGE